MRHLRNIFNLGIKELRSLLGDKAMLTLIVFSFTVSVYSSATVTPGSLNLAPIARAPFSYHSPPAGERLSPRSRLGISADARYQRPAVASALAE